MTAVFLHAFGGSARSWESVSPQISAPVLTPDLRGFGDSPSPEGPYDVASYARDLLALIEPLEQFILVGHSMGGKFALAVAAACPKGLQGLVLLAPSPPTPEPMTEDARRRLLEGYGVRAAMRMTVEAVARRPLAPDVREATIDGYLAASEAAWRGWLQVGSREDISDQMAGISVPVRILVGGDDPILGPTVQRSRLANLLENCVMEEISGAGHLLPIEVPEKVVVAVNAFLNEVSC